MAKKRTSMLDTLNTKKTSSLTKRMELVDELVPPNQKSKPEKKRTIFYLSKDAIKALDDVVYILKKIDYTDEKINNSTVVDNLIKAKRRELDKKFSSVGGFNALD